MIELLVLLALAALLTGATGLLWAVLRPPRRRRQALARLAGLAVAALAVVSAASLRLMDSRRHQLFGELVHRVETAQPLVALTFDDGPVPAAAEGVLELLAAEQVRATFFLNGEAVRAHPATAARIIAAGHEVGNHGHTHRALVGQPLALVRAEVEATDAALRAAGWDAPIHFRPPFGKKLILLPWYLGSTGRTTIMWDVEPETYADVAATPEGIVAHVLERAEPGSIVLLHVMYAGRATTRAALPGIIDGLRARGYRFVTVSELLAER
jgi:peptidoglycan-N-acetylglucosamine deacetylase